MPYEYQPWPSFCDGPNGERAVFDSEAEVPAGWKHHGETKKGKASPPAAPVVPDPVTEPVDAAGTPFDEDRHTGTKTQAGLWRMKVGQTRPESESKPLDL